MGLLPRILLGLTLSLLLAACGRDSAPATAQSAPAAANAAPLRKITLQADWFPQAEHGGYYQALVRGYYRDAGLDVEIWPGGPGAGIKLKVARGDADFGMNRSDDIILAVGQGMPLIFVGATLQHDPLALMVHAASPVKTFPDLAGRVVVGNVGLAYLSFIERKFGITFERRQNTYGLGEFLANPEIVQQCLVTNEPFFARQKGREVRTLSLRDAGYDSYHGIFCRKETVRNSPEVVRAFVAATARGWADYLAGDPSPAHAEILKRNPQITLALLEFTRGEIIQRRLAHGDAAKGEALGQLSLDRIAREIETLRSLGVLTAPLAVVDVATTDYLPASSRAP